MESPSSVLGVGDDADEEEIEAAYRKRVKEAHPDHGGSVDEFVAVRTAYEQLKARAQQPDSVPDPGPAPAEGADDPAEDPRRHVASSKVTYLNYDVLEDYGWDVDDDALFEKAADADLDEEDFGHFHVTPGDSLLEAAERNEFAWPFACRGGACANCAIVLRKGELSMPVNHVLPAEMMEQNIRLSCNGMPITNELEVVYNVKHMPELEDLLLPPRPFEQAYAGD